MMANNIELLPQIVNISEGRLRLQNDLQAALNTNPCEQKSAGRS